MARALAATRAKRLLAIVHLFRHQARIPLDRVATALGATVPDVVDDLELLMCCGVAPYQPDDLVPVYVEDGMAVIWSRLPALDRAPRLSAREAHAIVAALGIAGVETDDPLVGRLLSAAAVADVTSDSVTAALRTAPATGQPAIGTVALALAEKRVLRIEYQSAADADPVDRVVEPITLVNERGQWYLEAFCRRAGALRTFRLDRVRDAELLAETVPARKLSTTGRALATEGLPVALLRLAAGEDATEREWPGVRVVEQGPDGSLVEVPFAGTAWIARQVVARLGRAEVVGPAPVRDAVRELAEELARS